MEEVSTPMDARMLARSLRDIEVFAGVPEDRLEEIARIVEESTQQQVRSSLRQVDLFEGLSDEDLLEIQRISTTVKLEPGELLFEEGETGDAFYIVLRGAVELLKGSGEGEQKLAVSRSGGTFGEMALLNDTPRSATARAGETTTLLAITRDGFQGLLGEGIAVRLLQGLSKALWATSVRLAAAQKGKGAEDPRGVIRQVSRLIQRRLLPRSTPRVEGLELAADAVVSEADEGRVLWDTFHLSDGRRALASLEVRGEGLPPGHHLALCRVLLHELGPATGDPAELLARVNDALAEIHIDGLDQHVRAILLAVSTDGIQCASTGGDPLLIARADGEVERITPSGAPLGQEAGREFGLETVELSAGDAAFLITGRDESELPSALVLAELQEEEDPAKILDRLRQGSSSGSVIVVRRPGVGAAAASGTGAEEEDADEEGISDDYIDPMGDFGALPDIPRV